MKPLSTLLPIAITPASHPGTCGSSPTSRSSLTMLLLVPLSFRSSLSASACGTDRSGKRLTVSPWLRITVRCYTAWWIPSHWMMMACSFHWSNSIRSRHGPYPDVLWGACWRGFCMVLYLASCPHVNFLCVWHAFVCGLILEQMDRGLRQTVHGHPLKRSQHLCFKLQSIHAPRPPEILVSSRIQNYRPVLWLE